MVTAGYYAIFCVGEVDEFGIELCGIDLYVEFAIGGVEEKGNRPSMRLAFLVLDSMVAVLSLGFSAAAAAAASVGAAGAAPFCFLVAYCHRHWR